MWSFPFFLLVDTLVPALIVLSVVVLTVGLGAVVGGGFAPLIATALQTATGESWPVSAYLFAVGLVSLGAVLLLREMRGQVAAAGVTRTTS